jgi:hypothetical protein
VTIPFPAKLWLIEIDNQTINLTVPDNTSDLTFNIFPNPFDKTLKLSKRVDEIIIFDLSGRMITKQQFVQEISLENLNQGVYIAHLKINNSKIIRQIIKK